MRQQQNYYWVQKAQIDQMCNHRKVVFCYPYHQTTSRIENNNIIKIQTGMSSVQRKAPQFLIKTYQILENPSFTQIISWNDQQNGFIIHDVQQFSTSILPTYFKHGNMHSYIRQLNMYGFSKKRGRANNYYYHSCFLRKHPHLIAQITRRVENKAPKPLKASTVSIEDRLPQQNNSNPFLRINQVLLLEQCANLQLILNEMENDQLRESFSQNVKTYLESQNRLLQQLGRGKEKEKQACTTAGTLENCPQVINNEREKPCHPQIQ